MVQPILPPAIELGPTPIEQEAIEAAKKEAQALLKPPQPPEYYPGYNTAMKKAAATAYQAGKNLQLSEKSLTILQSRMYFPTVMELGAQAFPTLEDTSTDIFKQEYRQAQIELSAVKQEHSRATWRLLVLQDIPMLLANIKSGVLTADDVLKELPNADLQDDDRQWLTDTFSRFYQALPTGHPAKMVTAPQAKQQALTALLEPRAELRAVHTMTVDEILQSLRPYAIKLPETLTAEDVRTLMKEVELSAEDQKAVEDIATATEELKKHWQEQTAYYALIEAGLVDPRAPDLTPVDFAKMLATQPAMATFEMLNAYYRLLPRPLASLVTMQMMKLIPDPQSTELERLFIQYKELGENDWEAYANAYESWGGNWLFKMLMETVFDPTTYIGWGLFTKIAKPWPAAMKYVAAFEKGWNEMWDVPFKGLRQLIKKIPQTPTQSAISYGRQFFMDSRAFLERFTGKSFNSITAPDVTEAFDHAIKQAMARPGDTNDVAVRVGRQLLDYDYLNEATTKDWLTLVGGEGAGVTRQMTLDVNKFFEDYMRKGLEAKDTAALILSKMGVDPSEDNIAKIVSTIGRQRAKILDDASKLVVGEKPLEILLGVERGIRDMRLRNILSPEHKFMVQAGRSTALALRLGAWTDKIVQSSLATKIDRQITAPLANQYLLFLNYGPYNVLESSFRSLFGGGDVFYPKGSIPTQELLRVGKGLTNLPYEMIMYEKSVGRLEIAVIDPKTGKTMVFEKGRIPGVTREVMLPEALREKLPKGALRLPGKVKEILPVGLEAEGLFIEIGGKKYPIKSFQSWNDMWADIGTQQRAYYLIQKNNQMLWELAPEQMQSIADIFTKRQSMLDAVKSFTKSQKSNQRRILQNEAVTGPDAITAHSKVPILEMERRKALEDIRPTLNKSHNIYRPEKTTIEEAVLDGSAFINPDEFISGVGALQRERFLGDLVGQAAILDDMVKVVADFVPETTQDLFQAMAFISDTVEGISGRAFDAAGVIEVRADTLQGLEADNFHVTTKKMLADYMGKGADDVQKMLDHIQLLTSGKLDVVDWSKVAFGPEIPDNLRDTIRANIDRLPMNIHFGLRKVGIKHYSGAKANVAAAYYPEDKGIYFTGLQYVADADLLYHEMAHDFIYGRMARSGQGAVEAASTLSEFARVQELEVEKTIRTSYEQVLADMARTTDHIQSYLQFARVHEDFSIAFSDWLENPSAYRKAHPKMAEFLSSTFPLPRERIKITKTQQESLSALSDGIRLRSANMRATREEVRKFRDQSLDPKSPTYVSSKNRNNAWWKDNDSKAHKLWDEGKERDHELTDAVEELKLGLGRAFKIKEPKIPPIPEVVDKLTPAHVAYLMGTTGDSLYKALTKAGMPITIRSKDSFISWVLARAKKSAAKVNKTPETIGFSKEAIGDVYDTMFRNIGIEPAVASDPLALSMMELETVRQELVRIKGTKAIPENDYNLYKQYLTALRDDLGKLPMFQPGKALPSVNWGDAEFHKSITPEIRDRLDNLLSYLPSGSNLNLKRIMINPKMQVGGKFIESERILQLHPNFTAEDFFHEVGHALGIGSEADVEKFARSIGESYRSGKAPLATQPATAGRDAWLATREQAMMKARGQYELDFTDYSHRNMVDALMRMVFPFYTYEWQRWPWVARTFLKHPGVATSIGRYQDYSEDGYIPIPGTDIQTNPLRGTVFMGGFRRLMMRDYPEYYDQVPGMGAVDFISRVGFYPGFPFMLPIVMFGAGGDVRANLGEILPSWVKTPLDLARVVAPEQAGAVIDHFFPETFRDYITMLTLGEQGYDADEIWRKRKSGQKLTAEEQKLWLNAEGKATGLKGVLFEQTGIFRLRPEEYTQLRKDMSALIEKMTGVPVKVQETIWRRQAVTGLRLQDIYPLDVLQQKILYEDEAFRRWQGVTEPLYPSTWQQEDIATRDYFENVEKLYDDYRKVGVYDEQGNKTADSINDLTAQLISGQIGPDQWSSARADLLGRASTAASEMGKRDYPDVPKTLAQREARFKERGIPAVTYSPSQELMYMYFDIKPELRWDWEAGRNEYDYDTYYSKVDALIDSLTPEFKQRLLDRIQSTWNGMERLYWQVSRDFLRPYRLVRNAVLERYTPEQQQQIRRYEVARGQERTDLQNLPGPEGYKLIAHFRQQITLVRQRMRYTDPELDAWCYFFGITDTTLTGQAKDTYNQLAKQYLVPTMAK